MIKNKKHKALVLLSGGLDSILAVKILQSQGIEVIGICFKSNFYGCKKARMAAGNLKIKLKVIDIRREMLKLVKNPLSGYGKNLNPCLDCHAMMIKKAGEYAQTKGYNIIATGEVLGERPFSQNKDALGRVMKLSGLEVLRPLSAKLLPKTKLEEQGVVIRGKLFAFSGRNREGQMKLAEKYGIKEYPSPDGGCLLTDPGFSERLGKMLDFWSNCGTVDVEILKFGRVFWLNSEKGGKILLIIGRHKDDNKNLEKLAQKGDIVLQLKEISGPTALIRGLKNVGDIKNLHLKIPQKLIRSKLNLNTAKTDKEIIDTVARLTGYYSVKARDKDVEIIFDLIK